MSDDSASGTAARSDEAARSGESGVAAPDAQQAGRSTDEVATLAMSDMGKDQEVLVDDRQERPAERLASDGAAVRIAAITGAAVVAAVAAVAGLVAIMGSSGGAPAGRIPARPGGVQDRIAPLSARRESDLADAVERDPGASAG
jgi:hypothetical protein